MPQPTKSTRKRVDRTAGVLLLLVALAIACALGVNHWSRSNDTSLQEHVLAIASQLRAPGDHNSMTVATSSLTTAEHMRFDIQEDLLAGMTDRQIVSAMERAYGSQVLAAPAFGGIGRVFWVLPWLVLALLGAVGAILLRRGLQRQPVGPIAPADMPTAKADDDAVDRRLQDYL